MVNLNYEQRMLLRRALDEYITVNGSTMSVEELEEAQDAYEQLESK